VTLSNRMSMVVDIQETTDVYFTIPYMSRRPWLRTDTSVGAPHVRDRTNGSLMFNVLNPLAVPDGSVSSVDVLIWVYGSSDLEFALPAIGTSAATIPLLEEQCLVAELGDSKFGNLDGSFSVPGGMSMGEKIVSVRQMLAKKALIKSVETSNTSVAHSIYSQTSDPAGLTAILPYCHFRILAEMYLLMRGSVNYAGFARSTELGSPPYSEYYLGVNDSLLPTLRYCVIHIREAVPNAMVWKSNCV